MARRGEQLREHILLTAKDLFLDVGFERASMDVVASRAQTSKRSLYANFASKEKLFLAVIDVVRGLFLARLRSPGEYSHDPAEALVLFCGRYLEVLLYEPSIQMCRVSMAETARFPEQAAQYFDLLFVRVQDQLAAYLTTTLGVPERAGAGEARRLLGQVLYPRFQRALFGLDPLVTSLGDTLAPDFALQPIRDAVAALLAGQR